MTYTIPNRSSAQTVTLYFAETFLSGAGQRLFNVSINGTTVLTSFDIFAAAGGANRAITRSFTTTANASGQVVIQFVSGTQNPKVNGITVVAGGQGPTPTNTNTPIGSTNTPTSTPTRTNTPVDPTNTPTRTPTRTNTAIGPTNTPTPTPVTGGTCIASNATTITAPFIFDGAGTFCWRASNLGSFINSWNLASLTINGVNFANQFQFTTNLPPKAADGFWYISYTGNFTFSHFEAR
jgi:hypothetical protein